MAEFVIHPNVYKTSENSSLLYLLEKLWVQNVTPGDGTIVIISGFSNFNGSVRFLPFFKKHVRAGGRIVVYFGGSASQRLSSKQVVSALLDCGAEVNLINRKRILHSKCYGHFNDTKQSLIVSSGNFTGPGLSQNIESSIYLNSESIEILDNFSWPEIIANFHSQEWQIQNTTADTTNPCWNLLYDEKQRRAEIDFSEQITLIVTLGNADTARIQADQGDPSGLGSQYFWLSRDSFSIFPPLTIPNSRGVKATYSCLINLNYIDLGITSEERVTFEAENNLDFRLGTGKLRYTKIAESGDIAALTRVSENDYELRIIKSSSRAFPHLDSHAVNFIGSRGKRYGYIESSLFFDILNS